MLESKKKSDKKPFVEVKEFPADVYAQATDELGDDEMDDAFTVDGSKTVSKSDTSCLVCWIYRGSINVCGFQFLAYADGEK